MKFIKVIKWNIENSSGNSKSFTNRNFHDFFSEFTVNFYISRFKGNIFKLDIAKFIYLK